MDWSPQQDAALMAVQRWRDSGSQQVFRLFGFAGTGKTTLARHFAEGVGGQVLFAAYTGKAAHVLQRSGCEGATTIHSLIYRSRDKSQARLKQLEADLAALLGKPDVPPSKLQQLRIEVAQERSNLSRPAFSLNTESDVRDADMVIIDECSMVDGRMGEDLLSFEKPILVLGDPAQLPPIAGGGFFTGHKADVMLTEIHRQARDNPIIVLSTKVREDGQLELGTYGESRVIEKSQLNREDVLAADQLLVGRNATRREFNRRVRELKGRVDWIPIKDDKLVCLRNDHEVGLLNGSLWTCNAAVDLENDRLSLTVTPEEGGTSIDCEAHSHYLAGKVTEMEWWTRKEAQEFDYGYAMTVHKAQGSQWGSVMLFDEWRRDGRREWLYTAMTRAQNAITVVRM
jgi:exodeoxyribonuclease-5